MEKRRKRKKKIQRETLSLISDDVKKIWKEVWQSVKENSISRMLRILEVKFEVERYTNKFLLVRFD